MGSRVKKTIESVEADLRAVALGYPETYEETPWGERVVKVRGKIFMFSGVQDGCLGLTVKLPASGKEVLTRPYASPTGYNLGKSGWVTVRIEQPDAVPMAEMRSWIDESFRTVAPKRLIKVLDGEVPAERPAVKKVRASAGPAMALVGEDSLRLERARATLEATGLAVVETGEPTPDVLARIVKARPRAVVVDLGRNAVLGIEFARFLVDDVGKHTVLVFAGVRDGAADKKLRAAFPSAALVSRLPPGDGGFVEALHEVLGG